jgi:excisionase family DNA binding protein
MQKSDAERRGDALRQLAARGYATVPHAAVLMDLHHHTLRRYIEEGRIRVTWVGKRAWISAETIDRYNADKVDEEPPSFSL